MSKAKGPLTVHPTNSRYFTDGTGKAVYLTGSHNWNNFQDLDLTFDFDGYLNTLERLNHNFVRLWVEEESWRESGWLAKPFFVPVRPNMYERPGPEKAKDGLPKFDVSKFNPDYFARLRTRVEKARDRGIYVGVMLFQGYIDWNYHPYNAANNINGVEGNPCGDNTSHDAHGLKVPAVTALQEAYIRKVVDTVNDLDNVLYEVANEDRDFSAQWQYHVIRVVHEYESKKPKQHPVGITCIYDERKLDAYYTNNLLDESPADWVSPNWVKTPAPYSYFTNPPPAPGGKVSILDTDHVFAIGGDKDWVWKSFLRGHNPIFMDPFQEVAEGKYDVLAIERARVAMGHTRTYAQKMDLAKMVPSETRASSGYCLANASANGEYLVYLPNGGKVTVDLSETPGQLSVAWFNTDSGQVLCGPAVMGGPVVSFDAPFPGEAVLHLKAV